MGLDLTPKKIVEQLDHFIIGQEGAKKSVAVALRNRYRRTQLKDDIKDEIVPKNILMIGPTGVGKTEIARRLAGMVSAPFIKVEATKFTEVGYVGRDVESMVRDLAEKAVHMVEQEKMEQVRGRAEEEANKQLVKLLVPQAKKQSSNMKNPLEMLFSQQNNESDDSQNEDQTSPNEEIRNKRERIEHQLQMGELEDQVVTIEIEEQQPSMFDMLQGSGMEQMGMNMQDAFSKFMPSKKKQQKMPVSEARKVLTQQEADKLVDKDEAANEAVKRTEQSGIIFIDEIDKVAGEDDNSPNVSREGVQRDILPIVEGSSIVTKYGPVDTSHILFVAAGAFHKAKPSDLIPELQGRFPIRVELEKLSTDDFKRILNEPSNALLKQYTALLETEGIKVVFTEEAVDRLAEIAFQVNQQTDNIGARRLHTILEKLLEDLSYEAPDVTLETVDITAEYVDKKLKDIVSDKDLSQFIL